MVTSCLAFNTVLASRGASMDDAHHRYESLAHKADEERSRRAEHMRQLEYIRYGCTPNRTRQLISLGVDLSHITDAGGAPIDVDVWGDF